MGKPMRHRRLRAALGFLKTLGVLLVAPVWLLGWTIRAVIARRRFLQELRAAGVPEEAARMLSSRYKLRLRDLGEAASQASRKYAKQTSA